MCGFVLYFHTALHLIKNTLYSHIIAEILAPTTSILKMCTREITSKNMKSISDSFKSMFHLCEKELPLRSVSPAERVTEPLAFPMVRTCCSIHQPYTDFLLAFSKEVICHLCILTTKMLRRNWTDQDEKC